MFFSSLMAKASDTFLTLLRIPSQIAVSMVLWKTKSFSNRLMPVHQMRFSNKQSYLLTRTSVKRLEWHCSTIKLIHLFEVSIERSQLVFREAFAIFATSSK